MNEFFTYGRPGHYLLLLLLITGIAVLLFLRHRRNRGGRAEQLQQQYTVMTRELLDATPDEGLVNAVIANLMTKLEGRRPDPLVTMPQLSRGRCAVYFAWVLTKEIEHNGAGALKRKPASRFCDIGVEGLSTVGATETAAIVRAFLNDEGVAEQVVTAVAAEQPLTLCRDYIRGNPEEFVD